MQVYLKLKKSLIKNEIRPDDVVLEIGGNVGRNSCVIASILKDSSNLVVIESSQEIATQLNENRELNGLNFSIVSKALSKVPYINGNGKRIQRKFWTKENKDPTKNGCRLKPFLGRI